MAIDPVAAPLSTPLPTANQTPPANQVRADLSQPATAVAPAAPQPTDNAGNRAAAVEESSNDGAKDNDSGSTEDRGSNVDILASPDDLRDAARAENPGTGGISIISRIDPTVARTVGAIDAAVS
jgi:hypothetical protein